MTLLVTVCSLFCIMDTSGMEYDTKERCFEQGAILSGMMETHIPRQYSQLFNTEITVECKDTTTGEVFTISF